MLDEHFAPREGVARIVAATVEQLGEVEVEIAQEGAEAEDVGQADAELAAVFVGPHVERAALHFGNAHVGAHDAHEEFVREGADRRNAEGLRQIHVGRAGEEALAARGEALDHGAVPRAGIAAAQAEVGDFEFPRRLLLVERVDLRVEAAQALRLRAGMVAHVELLHDREDGDLEPNHVAPRAFGPDGDAAVLRRVLLAMHLVAVEPEALEVVAEVRREEADAAQVGDFLLRETQRAKRVELRVDRVHVGREVHAGRAQPELDAHVHGGQLVQHQLPHGELVEVLLEERADDGLLHGVSPNRRRARAERRPASCPGSRP